jgi:hypothetical protein
VNPVRVSDAVLGDERRGAGGAAVVVASSPRLCGRGMINYLVPQRITRSFYCIIYSERYTRLGEIWLFNPRPRVKLPMPTHVPTQGCPRRSRGARAEAELGPNHRFPPVHPSRRISHSPVAG